MESIFSIIAPGVKVYDVTGAGDTVIASLAACLIGDVNLTIKDALSLRHKLRLSLLGN